MKKQNILLILIVILVLMAGMLFGLWRKEKVQQKKEQAINEILKKAEEEKTFTIEEKTKENQKEEDKETEKPKEFVLPDMNQENWETYTDDAWGFSIKFPKEFYYKVHPQGETYPGEECMTCGNGGQLLIISDQREMGVQDYGINENVHIVVQTNKWNKEDNLENFINERHFDLNDGNKIVEIETKKYSPNDYLVRSYINTRRYPYGGVFYNKHLVSYNFNRYIIKNSWEYSIAGGVTFVLNNEEIDEKRVYLIESIISTFKFIK